MNSTATSHCSVKTEKHEILKINHLTFNTFQPQLQKRLQQEIRQHAEKHDGKLTYDNINELEYLTMVIQGMHHTLKSLILIISRIVL